MFFAQEGIQQGVRCRSAQDIAQQDGRQPVFLFIEGRGGAAQDGIHFVVVLLDGFVKVLRSRREIVGCLDRKRVGPFAENLFYKPPDGLFHLLFFQRSHHGKGHFPGDETVLYKSEQVFGGDFLHAAFGAQDGRGKRMTGKQGLLETVVHIVRRTVFVRFDLIDHHPLLRADLLFGERGVRSQLQQQRGRLRQVFLQHGGVKDDFFLGGIGVQLAAQAVEVAVDGRGALVPCPFEYRVFGKMGDPVRKSFLVPGAAADAQGAISHGRSSLLDCVLQAAAGFSNDHIPVRACVRC